MKVLILGANGMLGRKILQELKRKFDVVGTVNLPKVNKTNVNLTYGCYIFSEILASNIGRISNILDSEKPEIVINCIGITDQQLCEKQPAEAFSVNAFFPHQLACLTLERNIRLIHFSSDAVFSGNKGKPYSEDDMPDAKDIYGRSKFLGEINTPNAITLRGSIIGHNYNKKTGLVDWCMANKRGEINGYCHALFSGLTTSEMAKLVRNIIEKWHYLQGIWHVSGDYISKYALLCMINQIYDLQINIKCNQKYCCDRRLDSVRFQRITGWRPKSWQQMINEMQSDFLADGYNI